MNRAGFTMIELIFVIVILGILSAVALPKFLGVSNQAQTGKCDALVGTLNRTVGAALWSRSIANGNEGSLTKEFSNAAGIRKAIEEQITIPDECDSEDDTAFSVANKEITIGNKKFDANFTDGNISSPPEWSWTKK